MKTPVQTALVAFALQSLAVSALSFDVSSGALSNFVILGPGLLLLSSFQGSLAEKSKRAKKEHKQVKEDEDDKARDTPNSIADQFIEEIRESAKKVIQSSQEKVKDPPKKKPSPQQDAEMEPMKCFPKALCGVSSEVAQISKKQKNGLITDYLLLMRAIARNPTVVDDIIKPSRKKNKPSPNAEDEIDEAQDDVEQNDEDSSEEGEEDDEDSGEDEEEDDDNESVQDDEGTGASRTKTTKKVKPLTPDDKDHAEYLREKLAMDTLYKETLHEESWNEDNWWGAYGEGGDGPSVNKKKNRRPSRFRTDKPDDGTSGGAGGVSSFFSNLFSFGSSSGKVGGPSFPGMARDFPSSEVVPGIGFDEIKEILETAIEIGKGFDKPTQCNEIFNGCKYEYTDLLYMIDEMRQSFREKAKNGKRKGNKKAKTSVEESYKPKPASTKGSKGSKSKSRYRVTSKAERKKNKQTRKRLVNKQHDTDRVVIPNSHEKLAKLSHPHHHHQNNGSDKTSPGFSLTNMFSSWMG